MGFCNFCLEWQSLSLILADAVFPFYFFFPWAALAMPSGVVIEEIEL